MASLFLVAGLLALLSIPMIWEMDRMRRMRAILQSQWEVVEVYVLQQGLRVKGENGRHELTWLDLIESGSLLSLKQRARVQWSPFDLRIVDTLTGEAIWYATDDHQQGRERR